ncbi:ATP-grasp domain-containing protein [Micromonospora humi]|uniref:ATP-grasp domain-containing protein n=1 Tax=Micromonospora humi TaxID=745366 RepID=A0A1C5JP70_9ACTN|nr:ATP-grasp domain-containing protein [Micromonospora humi]SCG72385.1 ATP-grasp domain-containing protein [Micromonospora humi]
MATKRRLLVLSARPGVQRFCARAGIDVTVVYDDRSAGSLDGAVPPGEQRLYVERFNDAELVRSALARAGAERFDGVCTTHEKGVVLASLLAAELAVHRPLSTTTAVACRDKHHQKSLLHGLVDTARSTLVPDIRRWDGDVPADLVPGVLKPVLGAATRHTYRLDGPLDAAAARAAVLADPSWQAPRTFVVESFVDGVEHKVDGWVTGGRVRFFAVSRYLRPCLDIKDGALLASVALSPAAAPDLYARAGRMLDTVLPRLGLGDGVFHLEMFERADGTLVFGECAARVGGGVTVDVLQAMFGADLYAAAVLIALNERPAVPTGEAAYGAVGSTFLPSPVHDVPAPRELAALPGVLAGRYEVAGGKSVDVRKKTSARAGYAIVVGDDAEQVERRITDVVGWARRRVLRGDPR